ncbi:MAG: phosphate ABC transporter ATP-binding protein [Thermoguttaceae bacterium]|nr:phosphate ABC transporter ATP-binding protein [Thermoguttaceae bacterium]
MNSCTHIQFDHLTVHYGERIALQDVSFTIPRHAITAIIGPANAGKTTLLKCINRTIDFESTARWNGSVYVNQVDVMHKKCDCIDLRRRIGMVFPLPVGLPLSVYENVAYTPRRAGMKSSPELDALVEDCLRQAMLWDEVKDRLQHLGTRLSGGQQQRLTLARALSHRPEILCLDEFSIAIDPVTTMKIEDILREMKKTTTIVLVTNLVQQARRLSDTTAFLSSGRLVETGETEQVFEHSANELTRRYVCGEFG